MFAICDKLCAMRIWLALFICLLPLLASAEPKEIRVGLIDTFDQDFYLESFVPTIEYLQKSLKNYKLKVVEISRDNLSESIKKEKPDFLISSAGNYVTLMNRMGAQQIGTIQRRHALSPQESVSSVFVVRADRKDLKNIADLQGRSVSATSPDDFDGMLVALGEIAARGFDPDHFFSKKVFSHYQYPDVATYVKVGAVDAGILGTCQYEKLLQTGQIKPGELRILEPKDKNELCRRSTNMYPDTVFYSLDSAPNAAVKEVSLALLSMPAADRDFEWVPASGFLNVYDLMRQLKLGPFEHLRETTVKAFLTNYKTEILLAFCLLLAFLIHTARVNVLVNRRTEELKYSLSVQRAIEQEARINREKLDKLEKSRLISQMSSIFAHEVKQPITNLIYYSSALKLLIKQLGIQDDRVDYALKQMNNEAMRTSAIVEHVRSYARHKTDRNGKFDLTEVIERALRSINKEEIEGVKTQENLPAEAPSTGDPFEIELAILNVLKNALNAAKGSAFPRCSISVEPKDHMWRVTVKDNGPKISDEVFAQLGRPTSSTKKDGLGVGLSIVLSMIENNGGHISFTRIEPNGLSVELYIKKREE